MSPWQTLTASPHRLLFLFGGLQAVLTILWWLLVQLARLDVIPPAHPLLPPGAGHAWLMLYGLFPFFVFGFLFTALPNWVEGGRISRRAYLATALPMALGATLFYPALYYPLLAFAALPPYLAGWATGQIALLRVLRAGPSRDKRQPWLAWASLLAGLAGAVLFTLWLALEDEVWLRATLALAVWGFLTPLFLAVCHRMVPWFTSRIVAHYVIVRPYGPLWAAVAACLVHGVLETLGRAEWTWAVDLPLAAIALWFIRRWGITRAMPERLLAMLHIGFVWGGVSFALYAIDSLLRLAGVQVTLGLAPVHALGIGFFAAMLLAMATRVSLGHSGRPLKADGLIWILFWLVQLAAVTRMAADLFPVAAGWLMAAAALLWLLAFLPWCVRHLPWYGKPRADGKPG